MKENEKKGILILAIISIIIIVVLVMVFKPYKKKTNETNGQTPGQEQTTKNEQNQKDQSQTSNNNEQVKGQYVKTNDLGEKVNTSEKINTTKDIGEFTLTNVSLKESNGETALTCRITNKSGRDQGGFFGKIVLVDKSNKEVGRIPVKVSDMKAGETREIKATITESYAGNTYDYRLEK